MNLLIKFILFCINTSLCVQFKLFLLCDPDQKPYQVETLKLLGSKIKATVSVSPLKETMLLNITYYLFFAIIYSRSEKKWPNIFKTKDPVQKTAVLNNMYIFST